MYERIREREARRKREIEAAVEDALVAFCGMRRNPLFDHDKRKDPCDERMWANAAWKLGLRRFQDLIDESGCLARFRSAEDALLHDDNHQRKKTQTAAERKAAASYDGDFRRFPLKHF